MVTVLMSKDLLIPECKRHCNTFINVKSNPFQNISYAMKNFILVDVHATELPYTWLLTIFFFIQYEFCYAS